MLQPSVLGILFHTLMILETVCPIRYPPPIKLSADETNLFIFSNTGEDLQAGVNGKYCSLIIGSLLTLRTDIGADKDSR